MADVNKRIVGPKQLANSPTTEYTVPALTTTTIREIHLSNPTAASVTFTASIGADAAGTRFFDAYVVPANSVFTAPCHKTMAAAEILQLSAGTATAMVVQIDAIEQT